MSLRARMAPWGWWGWLWFWLILLVAIELTSSLPLTIMLGCRSYGAVDQTLEWLFGHTRCWACCVRPWIDDGADYF